MNNYSSFDYLIYNNNTGKYQVAFVDSHLSGTNGFISIRDAYLTPAMFSAAPEQTIAGCSATNNAYQPEYSYTIRGKEVSKSEYEKYVNNLEIIYSNMDSSGQYLHMVLQ